MDASQLNRLPSELRIQIYEYVFTYESLTCHKGRWSAKRYDKKYSLPLAREWGPVQVCKQMRDETLHLPFSLNTPTCGGPASDPHYEWSLATPLTVPCHWVVDTMRPALFTDAATFRLDLNIFPEMWQEAITSDRAWSNLSPVFERLLGAISPAKLVVTLNIYYHYESLDCMYPMPFQDLLIFQVCPGDPLVAAKAIPELKNAIAAQAKALERHDHHHDANHCRVKANEDRLREQLAQVSHVSRRFVEVAIWSCMPKGCRTRVCKELGLDKVFTHLRVDCESPNVRNCADALTESEQA